MTYADLIRSSTAQMNDVADLIDGLRVQYAMASDISTRTTSSSSFTALSGTNISVTTDTGDIVLILGNFRYSNTTAGQGGSFVLMVEGNGVAVPAGGISYDSSPDANRTTSGWFWIHSPTLPGIQNYSVQWATVAGTCYCGNSEIAALVFQNV